MSRENVEHAMEGYATLNGAVSDGDLAALRDLVHERFDPEVVLEPAGLMPETEPAHGHDGVLRFLETQLEAFEEVRYEPQEFRDEGDSVVVPVLIRGRARHTGIDLELERTHVWTYRDGKVLRLEIRA
jgi:ketosteroid isomerase-like protein